MEQIVEAAQALIDALQFDNGNGGLISRDTIRRSDELRILLLRWRKEHVEAPD